MSILTPAMKQYRDQLSASNSNCKVWFPCDDGSGTTITDVIGGVVETDATAGHNEPNAIAFGKTAGAVTSGAYPELKENLLLVYSLKVATVESFVVATLGAATFINTAYNLVSIDYGAGAGNNAATASSAIGSVDNDVVTVACAVIGDTLYHYTSLNNAGISENNNADASNFVAAFSAGNPTLEAESALFSVAVRQEVYGMALFTFDKDEFTTTEIIAALDEIDGNWPNGKKYLPSSIL